MSTTGSAVDALMQELIKGQKAKKQPKIGRPPKAVTKAAVRKFEKDLKG